MEYTLSELRKELFKNFYEVVRIFNHFFGEQHVDFQGLPSTGDLCDACDKLGVIIYYSQDSNDPENEDQCKVSLSEGQLLQLERTLRIPFILVWWPEVKITNEHDRSITIQDLYAKIPVTSGGRIPRLSSGFFLNRTTYPLEQFTCNYMHSHIENIPHYELTKFQSPCLGTGPILRTLISLQNGYDDMAWSLFCVELSKYVTVESIAGRPWHYLERVGNGRKVPYGIPLPHVLHRDITNLILRYSSEKEEQKWLCQTMRKFILYYLHHGHLRFSYIKGQYTLALSDFDYMVDISNALIDFLNADTSLTGGQLDKLYLHKILVSVTVKNQGFLLPQEEAYTDTAGWQRYEGRYVLTFKGEPKNLHILPPNTQTSSNNSLIINESWAAYIKQQILQIINFRYENPNTNGGETDSTCYSDSHSTAGAYQTAIYL